MVNKLNRMIVEVEKKVDGGYACFFLRFFFGWSYKIKINNNQWTIVDIFINIK